MRSFGSNRGYSSWHIASSIHLLRGLKQWWTLKISETLHSTLDVSVYSLRRTWPSRIAYTFTVLTDDYCGPNGIAKKSRYLISQISYQHHIRTLIVTLRYSCCSVFCIQVKCVALVARIPFVALKLYEIITDLTESPPHASDLR